MSEYAAKSGFFVNNKNIPAMPFIILGFLFCAVGGITAIMTLINGHGEMYAVTRDVPWGLLLSTYAYFVIISTGIAFIGGLAHAFGYDNYALISKRIVVLAVVILLAGFTQILMEVGSPLKMVYMMISPNFKAPIFWMGLFYGIELVLLAIELVLVFQKNPTSFSKKLVAVTGFFALVVGVLATSNLGYVFGSLSAKGWYHGIYFSVFLVVSGITAGAGVLILVHYIIYKGKVPSEIKGSLQSLGKLMGGGIGIMAFLYLWKMISSLSSPGDNYVAAYELVYGSLSLNFWGGEILLGVIIPLIFIALSKGRIGFLATAGFVFLIGLFFTRYDFIIAGQLPIVKQGFINSVQIASYRPSISEWLIYIFGLGVFFLLYFVAEKFLNLETEHH